MNVRQGIAISAALVAHALLIGLLLGLSVNPIVGVALPLLLGFGGYRLLESFTAGASTSSDQPGIGRYPPWAGWMGALWCGTVILSLLAGIGLRNGSLLGQSPPQTLSYIALEKQPAARVADLAIVCGYYDRLSLAPAQRRALAAALSDTAVSTGPVLTALQVFFGNDQTSPKQPSSHFGVFEFYLPHSR